MRFKGDDNSAATKFAVSAHDQVILAEARRQEAAARAAHGAEEDAAATSAGRVVFRAAAERKGAAESKLSKATGKRKAQPHVGAKALKNTKLLSFAADDEEEE